jgi:hypothetical protein
VTLIALCCDLHRASNRDIHRPVFSSRPQINGTLLLRIKREIASQATPEEIDSSPPRPKKLQQVQNIKPTPTKAVYKAIDGIKPGLHCTTNKSRERARLLNPAGPSSGPKSERKWNSLREKPPRIYVCINPTQTHPIGQEVRKTHHNRIIRE